MIYVRPGGWNQIGVETKGMFRKVLGKVAECTAFKSSSGKAFWVRVKFRKVAE